MSCEFDDQLKKIIEKNKRFKESADYHDRNLQRIMQKYMLNDDHKNSEYIVETSFEEQEHRIQEIQRNLGLSNRPSKIPTFSRPMLSHKPRSPNSIAILSNEIQSSISNLQHGSNEETINIAQFGSLFSSDQIRARTISSQPETILELKRPSKMPESKKMGGGSDWKSNLKELRDDVYSRDRRSHSPGNKKLLELKISYEQGVINPDFVISQHKERDSIKYKNAQPSKDADDSFRPTETMMSYSKDEDEDEDRPTYRTNIHDLTFDLKDEDFNELQNELSRKIKQIEYAREDLAKEIRLILASSGY